MVRCANCDAEIPAGGNFCVECGAPAPAIEGTPAATGATERLPEPAVGLACPSCGTRNPAGAAFCVTCGRPLSGKPVVEAPRPQVAPPQMPLPLAPASAAPAAPSHSPHSAMWGGMSGGLFLIGLAVLALTGWWWPGILVLIGITSLIGSLAAGKMFWAAFQGSFWMFGIAALAATGWWWPGILILIGLSAILGSVVRPKFG